MTVPPPPQLRAGMQLRAGLGYSTVLPILDFETYSEAGFLWDAPRNKWTHLPGASGNRKGLKIVGSMQYARHPSTEILCAGYDLYDGNGPQLWAPGASDGRMVLLLEHVSRGGLVEAWNSMFEYLVWNYVGVPRFGWPRLELSSMRCAMAKARANSLPGALADAASVLQCVHQKDPVGQRLIDKFSIPRNPTKADLRTRILPQGDPEGPQLYEYCLRDLLAETEVSGLCPDLSPDELSYWQLDQIINHRGVQIDMPAVENCITIIEQALERYNAELEALAGCKASETEQLKGWLRAWGVHTDCMDEDAIDALLEYPDLPPAPRRALEIRQAIGSASVKKVFAMRNQQHAGRLHNLYIFHGARTGRPGGADVQPTNLPKAGPRLTRCTTCTRQTQWRGYCPHCMGLTGEPVQWNRTAAAEALEIISSRSLTYVEHFYQDALHTIAGCLRGLFLLGTGGIASDYKAIEGVVTAGLAGCEWRLDVFRTHGKIYEASAAKAFRVPFEELIEYAKRTGTHHPLRDKGKRMELALGFGGWIPALRNRDIRYEGTDDEAKADILAWRAASPEIPELWGGQFRRNPWGPELYGLEGAAINAIRFPDRSFHTHGMCYIVHRDVLYCVVRSGGIITYHRPRLASAEPERRGQAVTYEGWNTNPKAGAPGWVRMKLYGGKQCENVVQKTARDIFEACKLRQHQAGFELVLHTYDEPVAQNTDRLDEFERIMREPVPWAPDWPIKAAGGWSDIRYGKD